MSKYWINFESVFNNATAIVYSVFVIFLFLTAIFTIIYLFFGTWKKIVFKTWVNRYAPGDSELGTSISDLLLFNLRNIKNIHDRSMSKGNLWNPYDDVPSFRRGLDPEIQLIASVELGNYGKFISGLVSILFNMVPLVFKPAEMNGSVNKFDDIILFLVTLDNYKLSKKYKNFEFEKKNRILKFFRRVVAIFKKSQEANMLWKIEKKIDQKNPVNIPEIVEELAYNMYIDLTGSDLFKSWDCFKNYTIGLKHYLSFIELNRDSDYDKAIEFYNFALSEEKNNPAVHYNLGVLYYFKYATTDNEKAINHFQKALNSSEIQLKARAHCGLSNALGQKYHRFNSQDKNDLLLAVKHGQISVNLNPELDSSRKALGFVYHQLSEHLLKENNLTESEVYREKAIENYQKAIALNREHYMAYNNLGNLKLEFSKTSQVSEAKKKELLKEAISYFESALEVLPTYHFAYDNLGNAYYELKDYENARENFINALIYKPDYFEARNDLAMLYLDPAFKPDITQAITDHNEVLRTLTDLKEDNRMLKLKKVFEDRLKHFNIDPSQYIKKPKLEK
jgi:tetratricopeptide (TPR) repeat protein